MHVAAHPPLGLKTRIRNIAPTQNANANAVDVGNSTHVRATPITATTTSVPAKRGPPKILSIGNGTAMRILRRSQNVHRQALSITRAEREQLNGHQGKVIWFTGLSGSGKSTLANALELQLHAQGKRTYILDGDNVRQGLNKDLGFTDADRVENIRRIAEMAKLMMDAGLIVMTAFISPFRQEREMARELIGAENFVEVFVDTPLDVCEQRDPKGLYKKARSGQLPNMTGINSPYEAPLKPDVLLRTNLENPDQMVREIVEHLLTQKSAQVSPAPLP